MTNLVESLIDTIQALEIGGGEDDPEEDAVNLHRTFDENGTWKPFKSAFECNEITTMMDV